MDFIYAFEKGLYCSLDEYSNVKSLANLCVHRERMEVFEAMHGYSLKKQKQKLSALISIFQVKSHASEIYYVISINDVLFCLHINSMCIKPIIYSQIFYFFFLFKILTLITCLVLFSCSILQCCMYLCLSP